MADSRPHVAMLVRNPYTNDSRVEKEAATLREAGYRVTVVADAGPGLSQLEARDGSTVRRVARRGPRIPGVSFMVHEWRLSRALLALRPDLLHAHDSNALLPVGIAARRLRRPYIYDAHDLWLHRPRRQRSRLYHALQNTLFAVIEHYFVPRAAVTLTVSSPIARHLERRYGLARVDLVPNYPEWSGDLARREIRDLPGLEDVPATAPIVLYLGGLMGGRGIEYLVRAIAGVPEAHLVLLGSGHQGNDLMIEARRIGVGERVHVVPPVSPGEVIAYTRSATIGVSPIVASCLNYEYSLPNKLFQYMAAGIPVVASDFPQVREIVVGSDAGLVVDTQRADAIATAINELLGDPAEARLMGERGRAAIEGRHNWSTSATTLAAAYRRATTGRELNVERD